MVFNLDLYRPVIDLMYAPYPSSIMRRKISVLHKHNVDEGRVFEEGPNLVSSNIQALHELLLTLRCHVDAEVILVDCCMRTSMS